MIKYVNISLHRVITFIIQINSQPLRIIVSARIQLKYTRVCKYKNPHIHVVIIHREKYINMHTGSYMGKALVLLTYCVCLFLNICITCYWFFFFKDIVVSKVMGTKNKDGEKDIFNSNIT